MADKDSTRVSDSEDVGTANARADQAAIADGERNFGKNNSSIRNRAHMPSPEPKVGPFIKVYKDGGLVQGVDHLPNKAHKVIHEAGGEKFRG